MQDVIPWTDGPVGSLDHLPQPPAVPLWGRALIWLDSQLEQPLPRWLRSIERLERIVPSWGAALIVGGSMGGLSYLAWLSR